MAVKRIVVNGLHGLGDNIHQRALVRTLLEETPDVWVRTPWPCVYHDLAAKCIVVPSPLRTQQKNSLREGAGGYRDPNSFDRSVGVGYSPDEVRRARSVLGAMAAHTGVAMRDFRMPVPEAWLARADALIASWRPERPLMFYRPLNERSEWGGCPTRNPDHGAYAALWDSVRRDFHVVSVADVEPGREWIVGREMPADTVLHAGELDFEAMAAVVARSALVFASPGFAVVLAQAVGTPVACVFGGYEAGYSFSAGAAFAPYLPIEPIRPCDCFRHGHACDKRIDIPAAVERLRAFCDQNKAVAA